MRLIKGLIAVVVGYFVMTATSMGVVGRLFGEDAAAPDTRALLLALLFLGVGAFIGGAICTLIVGSANSPAIYVAIGLVAVVMGRSVLADTGIEPDWYKILSFVALAIGFLVGASTAAYRLQGR